VNAALNKKSFKFVSETVRWDNYMN